MRVVRSFKMRRCLYQILATQIRESKDQPVTGFESSQALLVKN